MAALVLAPDNLHAQTYIAPPPPVVYGQPIQGPFGLRPFRPFIPRTYSYDYQYLWNMPRHYRYVGPDGRRHWRSTLGGPPRWVR